MSKFIDQDHVVCTIVASHYINAGYYTTTGKLARFAKIIGRIPMDMTEHIVTLMLFRISKPRYSSIRHLLTNSAPASHSWSHIAARGRINPMMFRMCELLLFFGPLWHEYMGTMTKPIRRVPAFLHDVKCDDVPFSIFQIVLGDHSRANGFNYAPGYFQPTYNGEPVE